MFKRNPSCLNFWHILVVVFNHIYPLLGDWLLSPYVTIRLNVYGFCNRLFCFKLGCFLRKVYRCHWRHITTLITRSLRRLLNVIFDLVVFELLYVLYAFIVGSYSRSARGYTVFEWWENFRQWDCINWLNNLFLWLSHRVCFVITIGFLDVVYYY